MDRLRMSENVVCMIYGNLFSITCFRESEANTFDVLANFQL